jgi:hypothetical protein
LTIDFLGEDAWRQSGQTAIPGISLDETYRRARWPSGVQPDHALYGFAVTPVPRAPAAGAALGEGGLR